MVPDEIAYFIIDAQAAGQISIDINYCFNPEALKDPMFEYLFEQAEAGVNNFNVQDVYADTMVQRGLNSRFGPRGRYSWQEGTLPPVQPLAGATLSQALAVRFCISKG